MPDKKISKKQSNVDFEIQFIESILKENPNFTEALSVLGGLYTQKGLYEKGLQVDERLSCLRPNDAIAHYNLACSYSLLNSLEKSFEALKRAFELGYDDVEHLNRDPDLMNLRQDNRFQEFFVKIRNTSLPK